MAVVVTSGIGDENAGDALVLFAMVGAIAGGDGGSLVTLLAVLVGSATAMGKKPGAGPPERPPMEGDREAPSDPNVRVRGATVDQVMATSLPVQEAKNGGSNLGDSRANAVGSTSKVPSGARMEPPIPIPEGFRSRKTPRCVGQTTRLFRDPLIYRRLSRPATRPVVVQRTPSFPVNKHAASPGYGGLLLECVDSPDVDSVLVVGRSPCGVQHEKVTEILRDDFFDYSDIEDELAGLDACFFTLGVSAAGMSEQQYHRLTYDLTVAAAEALLKASPQLTFVYVSGTGTDSTEKGRIMWARVKGKTENRLLEMGFGDAYMFRPGYIQPMRGIRSKTTLYRWMYASAPVVPFPWLPVVPWFPRRG